jgi:hypothetical protein
VSVLTAVDTIHKYVTNIPEDNPAIGQVQGYITGDADIRWTSEDWKRFPRYRELSIAQLPDNDPAAWVLDVEPNAATDLAAVDWTKKRHAAKRPAFIYVSKDNVAALYRSLAAAKEVDQTYIWLANWNLDQAEAEAMIGTEYEGFKVVGVQWASPTSNPKTYLPGTNYTLADCGCDLSVFAESLPAWKEPAAHLVSVMAVATYSDGSKKSWSVG